VPHRDSARGAFRQFQYLTAPLHVHEDHIEHAWATANDRVAARFEETER
jgi:hypothetical protein